MLPTLLESSLDTALAVIQERACGGVSIRMCSFPSQINIQEIIQELYIIIITNK
jgi:hypothetical protein